jgi:hypothetical protein
MVADHGLADLVDGGGTRNINGADQRGVALGVGGSRAGGHPLIVSHRPKRISGGASGSVDTMTRARTALVVAGSVLLVAGLSACEKPNPGATVFSGTTSRWQQAACWSHDSAAVDTNKCARDVVNNTIEGATVPTIPVVPGQVIGISVDPSVADVTWQARVNNQSITTSPISNTYFRFAFPDLSEVPPEGILMQIVAGKEGAPKGIWLFKIVRAT